jgi:hypothetical protein
MIYFLSWKMRAHRPHEDSIDENQRFGNQSAKSDAQSRVMITQDGLLQLKPEQLPAFCRRTPNTQCGRAQHILGHSEKGTDEPYSSNSIPQGGSAVKRQREGGETPAKDKKPAKKAYAQTGKNLQRGGERFLEGRNSI